MNNRNALAPAPAARNPAAETGIHTTLPMEELVGLFESEIRTILRYDSFEYENMREGAHYFQGTPRLHKCHYRINIGERELGRITFTRATPFADLEISRIEATLGALLVHLNNALDHQAELGETELGTLRIDREYTSL